MNEPVTATMSEVRRHLASTIDRARHDHTPTFITQRGRTTAVLLDAEEYQRLLEVEQAAEDAWLNRLADEAEEEGREGSVSLEEMARELARGEE
ncbi:type II toxin-antitoxin system Phd/YefM family antitoxin [Nocardiopsis halotolerans]|uniref:type II toxin-antitoxin system Phd/YefM family antitoxin n=1 Tax=Nocardiopsis halotolerans TaxID=124252 RepID=UPI00034790E9|nr:type II toxin-antitoxin system Phd/YefM family antitoxin [Nocardiopsis halotolerans]